MKPSSLKLLFIVSAISAVLIITGCSTQKNTAKTRWWHSFKAKYNIMYNGSQAYIDGSLEKEKQNKDNFTEIIPLYPVGNKRSAEIGKGNYEKAIEKCQKAIKLHSIKRKPQWTKKRRKTDKDIEWLGRKEYNPYLWKSWLLMGRAQFHKGAFDEAASTFSYMSRLYQTQPAIYGRARAWLAKSYIEQDWLYDAEDVIRNMKRDSIHWRARKEWDYTYADYYIHLGDYEEAIPYLKKVIKHERRRVQKAREWFLLGQLYSALGQKDMAYKAYKHVPRLSPPYEVEFNAHIAMTEVMAGSQAKKMIRKLKRMAVSDNNKDYLDQVYYAIGNIYLAEKDTTNAIYAYEKGNEKSTRNGVEKGVLLLKLGDLYWAREKYNDCQRCYGEAIGLLDKEREDYDQLAYRSKVLDELVPYTDAVHLQDSLQELAKMSEKDRNAAIDRVIEALKKKEKEERDRLAEQNAQNNPNQALGNDRRNTPTIQQSDQQKNALWYFYNQMAVNQGKASFQKQWGKRENEDNWQRSNKTVVAAAVEEEMTEEQLDSIAQAESLQDSLEQAVDSAQFDPHKREYYLAQIPFTEDQVIASNMIIKDGLYNSGVIFKDKLDNLPLSEKALRRVTDQYPDYEGMANVYYHLFLLYSRMGEPLIAETYIEKLKAEYPDNNWTTILTDPYFRENSQFGVHIEDSLYAATYDAFKADRYSEVRTNTQLSAERFPLGANRDKFMFIGGLSKLNNGDADGCLEDMKTVVKEFPQSKLSEMAGMIINGVQAGRVLRGGKFDIGDVWARRSAVLSDSDSIAARTFSNERNAEFMFIIAYMPDSVNENQVLYQLAKYNFTSYMVRNFDIVIEDLDGIHLMQVTGFQSYDEALQYARQFHKQHNISTLLEKARTIIISKENKELLGTRFSFDEYDEYYNKHFAPLKISTFELLSEPTEIATEEDEKPRVEDIDDMLDDNIFDNGLEGAPQENGIFLNPDEETVVPTQETVIPADDSNTIVAPEGTEVIETPETSETPVQPETNEQTVTPVEDAVEQPAANDLIIEQPSTEQPTTDDLIIDQPATEQPATDDLIINQPATEQPTAEDLIDQPAVENPKVEENIIEQPALEQPVENVVIQQPAVEEPAKKEEVKEQPTAKQPVVEENNGVTIIEEETPQISDDVIYFDEDEVAPATSTNKKNEPSSQQEQPATKKQESKVKKKPEPDPDDIEDEYYDLDGF